MYYKTIDINQKPRSQTNKYIRETHIFKLYNNKFPTHIRIGFSFSFVIFPLMHLPRAHFLSRDTINGATYKNYTLNISKWTREFKLGMSHAPGYICSHVGFLLRLLVLYSSSKEISTRCNFWWRLPCWWWWSLKLRNNLIETQIMAYRTFRHTYTCSGLSFDDFMGTQCPYFHRKYIRNLTE